MNYVFFIADFSFITQAKKYIGKNEKGKFSSFNFNLELIFQISSILKFKEENFTFFIVYRFTD